MVSERIVQRRVANAQCRQVLEVLAGANQCRVQHIRWAQALRHVETHRGVGRRILDGRQVAVLAAATTGNLPQALALVKGTEPGDAWENGVTAAPTALCRPGDRHAAETAVGHWLALEVGEGLAVFSTRLALIVLTARDTAGPDTPRPETCCGI
ncbi:hypothetical protein ACFXKJ_33675 [Kitasatospora indigofera]|uniref:hypothetical protein n=1 Tax=Kitasatospora indigofera TaxID=67307 RepID=UPI0036BA9AE3